MDLKIKNKRVVVAGGSRGIGRAIAMAFAQEGAAVSICARGADGVRDAEAALKATGASVHAATCDLGDGEVDGVRLTPPTITFEDRLWIDGGDLALELFSTPGHQPDHISVWIPQIGMALGTSVLFLAMLEKLVDVARGGEFLKTVDIKDAHIER